ncbi:ankyrin repeat domain-containing protein [Candidatus Sororendozoicomonas aggregata]|uniref:ankyrin repeat domain-containing protein n=1 Tax=Candidatus Sororendozoicomonas aggregata TaxID=3073239 RepID=UPI002ED5EA03
MRHRCLDIHQATRYGSITEVELFLSEGVSINCGDRSMMTPLMFAAYQGDCRMLNHLIQLGADLNLIDHFGRTALIRAIASPFADSDKKVEMVHQLLRAGANPIIGISYRNLSSTNKHVPDEDIKGCMGLATKYGEFNIAKMCLNFGARPLPASRLRFDPEVPDATKKEFEVMANNPVSLQSMTIKLIREHVSQDKIAELPIPPGVLKDRFGLPNTPVENPKVEGEDPPFPQQARVFVLR